MLRKTIENYLPVTRRQHRETIRTLVAELHEVLEAQSAQMRDYTIEVNVALEDFAHKGMTDAVLREISHRIARQ